MMSIFVKLLKVRAVPCSFINHQLGSQSAVKLLFSFSSTSASSFCSCTSPSAVVARAYHRHHHHRQQCHLQWFGNHNNNTTNNFSRQRFVERGCCASVGNVIRRREFATFCDNHKRGNQNSLLSIGLLSQLSSTGKKGLLGCGDEGLIIPHRTKSDMPPLGPDLQAIKARVDELVRDNSVIIFSKTWCPFCKKVSGIAMF